MNPRAIGWGLVFSAVLWTVGFLATVGLVEVLSW